MLDAGATPATCAACVRMSALQAAAANPQQAEQRPGTAAFGSSSFR